MPVLKTWRVRDGGGNPDPTATPQILAFVDRGGVPLTPQPNVVNLGLGEFGIMPTLAQEGFGGVYLVDNGATALNRYEFGAFFGTTTIPLDAFLFLDVGGALFPGPGTPTFALYVDPTGAPRAAPAMVALQGSHLFCTSPTQADLDAGGTTFIVNGAVGASPESYDGSFSGAASPAPIVTPSGIVVDLLGVLETGAVRSAGVPENVRKTLNVVAGSNVTYRFRCVTPDGASVVGGTFDFSVSKKTGDSFRAIKKSATAIASALFTVLPADTKSMSAGLYAWDVWYTDSSGRRAPVIPPSPFKLESAVTPAP